MAVRIKDLANNNNIIKKREIGDILLKKAYALIYIFLKNFQENPTLFFKCIWSRYSSRKKNFNRSIIALDLWSLWGSENAKIICYFARLKTRNMLFSANNIKLKNVPRDLQIYYFNKQKHFGSRITSLDISCFYSNQQ